MPRVTLDQVRILTLEYNTLIFCTMIESSKIIRAGLAGTTVMTVFSYYLSEKTRQNFKEPDLLARWIIKKSPRLGRVGAHISGWMIHYLVGIFFAAIYKRLYKNKCIKRSLPVYAITGAITGVVAVFGWKALFLSHPGSLVVNRKNFYGQLIIAHAVFGTVTIYVLDNNGM